MILLVQGCQESATNTIDNEILVTEMTSDLQNNEFHKENDWLLTEEEARQALLWMIVKEEARSKALSALYEEENEAIRKINEENERKEKELLEIAEHDEDVNHLLKKLKEETYEQTRNIMSYYYKKHALIENTAKEYRDYTEARGVRP
jgi:hypothetical protein